MRESIIKPSWLETYEYLKYSYNINKFITLYNIKNLDDIDLNILRDYYKKDKESCLELIDEFVFRGFKFNVKKETPLLPNININEDDSIILMLDEKKRYKNINFGKLDISNFIKRFKVESDYFFNYIRLDYFLYFNRNLNISTIKEEFDKHGIEYYKKSSNKIENYSDLSDNRYKVEDVFYENIYNLFVSYCEDNNIIYIDELKNFNFTTLYNVNRLGDSKIKKIISKYNDFIGNNINDLEQNTEQFTEEENIIINDDFKRSDVNSLLCLGVAQGVIDRLKNELGIDKLEILETLSLSQIKNIKGIGKSKLDDLIRAILLLNQDASNLYIPILNQIKQDKNFDIYSLRCKNKFTLEEIGHIKGCTRERTRQLEKKFILNFNSYFDLFYDYFIENFNSKKCINNDDILNLFSEYDDLLYIKYAMKNEVFKDYVYIESVNKFVKKQYLEILNFALESIKENISDVFKIEEEIDNINDILISNNVDFIEEDEVVNFLIKYGGYKKLNDYFWKGRDTIGKICTFVIKEHFPNGIKICSEELEKLKSIIKYEFGIELEGDIKSIGSRIADENILCDRGKYINPDFVNITNTLINEIKEYIYSKENESIAMVDLFTKFKERLLSESNINNRYFLHGVIKYYYNNEFTFTRDTVSGNGQNISPNKMLENYLKEKNEPVNINELKYKFPGWTSIMFINAQKINENILQWDYGYYIHKSYIKIDKDELLKLKKMLDFQFKDGIKYITVHSIFNKFKLKMRDLYRNNNIKNSYNLFYLLESLYREEYIFKRNIIYKKGLNQSEYTSVFDMYINERELINYEEFINYFKELKFKESTVYAGFNRISKKLIQISFSEYIKSDNFKLSESEINQVKEFICNKFDGREYISMFDVTDFSSLPNIGYEWTSYLITEIIEKYIKDYKIIEKKFKDRRYRRPIIVKNNCEMKNIVDVIIYIIKNEYDDPENLTLTKIRDYLITKNIFLDVIPNEFYDSEKVSIDEHGRISLEGK